MNKVQIFDAAPEDAYGIINVLYKAWIVTYPNKDIGITIDDVKESYKDGFLDENLKKLAERIRAGSSKEKRIVAKIDDVVVGILTIVRNSENNQIKTIYVLPEFHNNGIGTMMWNEARTFCDNNKDTIVQVATYNEQAINFYKKIGFIDTGKRFTDDKYKMKSGVLIPEMEMVLKRNL